MQQKLIETRKRLRDDYPFYAEHCVKIRTKTAEIKPLAFNTIQRKLSEVVEAQYRATGRVRVIILKARQQGLSTYTSGRLYFRTSQNPGVKGLVVAHKADSSKTLFDMYQRIHTLAPDLVRPSTKYSSRRELAFDKLQSGITVATAGGDGVARGETIQTAHLSEVAFWPTATAKDNMNALMQSIPNAEGTEIYIESTACGMGGNLFYELWQGAVAGENGFIPFFSPWFDSDEYRMPCDSDFERTYEEQDLVERYGLDNEQLKYRRTIIAQVGLDKWNQEYPSCSTDAFLASGRPVFNPELTHELLRICTSPSNRMAVEGAVVRDHPRGELLVYHPRDASAVYTIGADVGMGIRNGDYSVAQILDHDRRQVAMWRGQVHPDYFADVLEALGYHYNTARIAVENNNHGLLTAIRLGRDKSYPNVYTEVNEGALNDKDSISIGFRTTAKTKPLIIDRLRASLRDREIEVNDETTLREMLSYVVTETGQMEAEEGCHDDCVMSLAIANHLHEGRFVPVNVNDDYYIDAI